MKVGYSPEQIMELYTEMCHLGMENDINHFLSFELNDVKVILERHGIDSYIYNNLQGKIEKLNMTQRINVYESFLEIRNKII